MASTMSRVFPCCQMFLPMAMPFAPACSEACTSANTRVRISDFSPQKITMGTGQPSTTLQAGKEATSPVSRQHSLFRLTFELPHTMMSFLLSCGRRSVMKTQSHQQSRNSPHRNSILRSDIFF